MIISASASITAFEMMEIKTGNILVGNSGIPNHPQLFVFYGISEKKTPHACNCSELVTSSLGSAFGVSRQCT